MLTTINSIATSVYAHFLFSGSNRLGLKVSGSSKYSAIRQVNIDDNCIIYNYHNIDSVQQYIVEKISYRQTSTSWDSIPIECYTIRASLLNCCWNRTI